MATQLNITSSTSAGFNTGKSNGASNANKGEDVFAALLGVVAPKSEPVAKSEPVTKSTTQVTRSAETTVKTASNQSQGDKPLPEDPEAIAAPVEAQTPIQPVEAEEPKLTELVEGLADLKAKLEAGAPLTEDELAKLDSLLTDLAQALGVDLSNMPSAEQLAAMVANASAAGAPDTLTNQLTEAFGPLASALEGHVEPNASADFSAQIKSVGDKLAAILAALNEGDVDPDALAEMDSELTFDAELKAALERALKPTTVEVPEPVLAKPALDMKETDIGIKAGATTETKPEAELAKASNAELKVQPAQDGQDKANNGNEQKSDDRKPIETRPDAKPVAAATQTATEQQVDPTATPQPIQQARVDLVAAPRVVQAGYQTSQQQLNLPQLAFEMVRQVSEGNTRFQIRLDPADLGKIDVRLDIDASGQVNARLSVEKAETLDLMQRDQKALERALQQAGLDSSKTNLEFSLKQNPFSGGDQGQNGNGRNPLFGGNTGGEVDEAPLPAVSLYRGNLSASGVNIIA
ncbi:MAG: flagellar hook-length control protein FliK [Candidatus Devosia phytovorans]|uniref:Flagellar hook-length control protein FliK n=1 Tax=Candidatus Devosia phytovorans TaxID=3121372 RepID=A0AAJ6AZV3_9HYPH|nr:flagellar hook-length control protein FliK [Devosia sp.]WEK04985.1 MAG: flagellar hook-length control protein FliK [Devosia sp.]